jgi:hypothetical protein
MLAPPYERSVFVNCPFDAAYRSLFESIVFTIHDCGYAARCALEVDDASVVRIDKIAKIIASCRLGIHDISRTEPDLLTGLPRFNMPLELGMFLGAKRYGRTEQRRKICLIVDVERYRYQKFISDIAGQDVAAHAGDPMHAIRIVRDWLSSAADVSLRVPGGHAIATRYVIFRDELPEMCERIHLAADDLTFNEYVAQVERWLALNARIANP